MRRALWVVACAVVAVGVLGGVVPGSDACAWAASGQAIELVREAEAYLAAGQGETAVTKLKEAAALEPDWYVPASRLAVAYQICGLENAALQQYMRVQRMSLDADRQAMQPTPQEQSLLAEAEGYMTLLVNKTRLAKGEETVWPHPQMAIVARGHAAEMRDSKYFSHESPTASRRTIVDRFRLVFGYRPRVVAENLSRRWTRGHGYTLSLAKIGQSHEDLLKSHGHRRNIVMPGLTNIGIGCAVNSHGDYWLAQVFADLTGYPEY